MDESLLMIYSNDAFWIYVPRLATLGTVEGMYDDPVKVEMVAKAAWSARYTKICIDDEGGDNSRILRTIATIRQVIPQMKIGVFCFPQIYWNWTPEQTHAANDAAKAVLAACDFAVPGIDLRWDMSTLEGRQAWLALLKTGVAESARMMPGKPCYPFLPIEYNSVLKMGELSAGEMAWQLQQCQSLGLKPILWGGFQKTTFGDWHKAVK